MVLSLRSNRVLRFMVIGLCNAAISFGILNLAFYAFDQSKIVSSIIATSCAVLFSFAMNRIYVFNDRTQKIYQQFPLFVVVTVSGSIIILNAVYIATLALIDGHESLVIDSIRAATGLSLTKSFVDINISTAVGAAVALVWNYNGYRWFVFKGTNEETES